METVGLMVRYLLLLKHLTPPAASKTSQLDFTTDYFLIHYFAFATEVLSLYLWLAKDAHLLIKKSLPFFAEGATSNRKYYTKLTRQECSFIYVYFGLKSILRPTNFFFDKTFVDIFTVYF